MPKRVTPSKSPVITVQRGNGPMARQIAQAIGEAIDRGELRPGDRLPSTRALARALAVSRNLVAEAFEDLVSSGQLVSRTGSGSYVAGGKTAAHAKRSERKKRSRSTAGRGLARLRAILKGSGYPLAKAELADAEGNPLYIYTA